MKRRFNKSDFAFFDSTSVGQIDLIKKLREQPKRFFEQKEFFNIAYIKTNSSETQNIRNILFDDPTSFYVLNLMEDEAESDWTNNPFDVAHFVFSNEKGHDFIQIKNNDCSENYVPPITFSAYRLAHICIRMIENHAFENVSINYIEVDWALENDQLVCRDAHFASLFAAQPNSLYINWAAAMQIQFRVTELDQTFSESREVWAKKYLRHFTDEARKRAETMIQKFVLPFEKYL